MNVPEDIGSQVDPPRRGTEPKGITVRQLAVAVCAATAYAMVWRRTGGDFLLSVGAIPFVYSSVDRWIV